MESLESIAESIGGGYTVERELTGGGMSRVFVAEETRLRRKVVIKLLLMEMSAGISADRFEREVMLAAGLQEPHIVPVLTVGETRDGIPYYVMPWVAGDSLRARMMRERVPKVDAISILRDVALALAYAHRRGIVHRDIKPDNVLLSEGTAVVTDFGIARALKVATTHTPVGALTAVGTSLGTPAYMAPEQAAGDEVDARADLYAWGVMAYELLSGKHPFKDRTSAQALIVAHVSETPRSLAEMRVDAPRSVLAIVTQCLAKNRDDRPTSADALIAALDGARPAIESARSRRVAHVRRAVVAVAGIVVIGAALALRGRADETIVPLVAVLPFESEGDGADSMFAAGLTDAVTGKLAQLPGLRVIDRQSVTSLTGADRSRTAQQIGRTLGAGYVLRGTLRWQRVAGGPWRVQVSPTLVNVDDGTAKWAGDPEIVSPADPFAVQARLATNVARALDVAVGSRERARLAARGTSDTAAFSAYVHAERLLRENIRLGGLLSAFQQAAREFARAYRADPNYADALGGAAEAMMRSVIVGASPAFLDSADALAKRALALSATQPDAMAAAAGVAVLRSQPREALDVLDRAVRENPSNARLLEMHSWLLAFVGDSAGAWNAAARLLTLAPRSPDALRGYSDVARALRRLDDAESAARRAIEIEPERADGWLYIASVAEMRTDTAMLGVAIRELRAHGGRLGVDQLPMVRRSEAAIRAELASASPSTYGASSGRDSTMFYVEKADLFMATADQARVRALLDSAWTVSQRALANPYVPPPVRRYLLRKSAWIAAGRGDSARALQALAAASPPSDQYRVGGGGFEAAGAACSGAEVYALLGDADRMLAQLRNCLTLPFGRGPEALTQPSIARYASDPRLQELARLARSRQARVR